MDSDFPDFQEAYIRALLPDNPDQFDLLAAHANFSLYHSDLWHGTARRFAEAIVKECAGIYDKIDNGNEHLGTDNYLLALQKHFGIKQ